MVIQKMTLEALSPVGLMSNYSVQNTPFYEKRLTHLTEKVKYFETPKR